MPLKEISLIFGIFAYFSCSNIFAVLCNTNFTKYIFHGEYSDSTCPGDSSLFIDFFGSNSKCMLKCSNTPLCYGVFIEPGFCVGCSERFITKDNYSFSGLFNMYFRRQTYIKVEERMDWDESKRHCEDLGGYLADIKSAEEEMYIENHFPPSDWEEIWIGSTDLENEDIFLWTDGSKMADYYTNWAEHEPSKVLNDHCVTISNRDMKIGWRDWFCGKSFASLCEFE